LKSASPTTISREVLDCRLKLFEVTVRFSCLHHRLAISIERIIDDPFGCVYFVIVFVTEMPKAFGNGLKSGAFWLTVKRVVGVRGIYDFSEKDEREIIGKLGISSRWPRTSTLCRDGPVRHF
jgi:hypothetical protein